MLSPVVDALRRAGQGSAMNDKLVLAIFAGIIYTMIVGTVCVLVLRIGGVI